MSRDVEDYLREGFVCDDLVADLHSAAIEAQANGGDFVEYLCTKIDLTEISSQSAIRRRRMVPLLLSFFPLPVELSERGRQRLGSIVNTLLRLTDDWHLISANLIVVIDQFLEALPLVELEETPPPAWLGSSSSSLMRIHSPVKAANTGLVASILLLVDTPVYPTELRRDILRVLRRGLERDPEVKRAFYLDKLINAILEQGRSDSDEQCVAHLCAILVLITAGDYEVSVLPAPAIYPARPLGPPVDYLVETWPVSEMRVYHVPCEREIVQFLYDAYPQQSVEYADACSLIWPSTLGPLFWDLWIDQLVLNINSDDDKDELLRKLIYRSIAQFADPSQHPEQLQYLCLPLIEVIKLHYWTEFEANDAQDIANMLLACNVCFLKTEHGFVAAATALHHAVALVKRASPLASGPDFDCSEYRCFRLICETFFYSGMPGAFAVLVQVVPVVLKFIEADITDNSHLYHKVGFVGKNVLKQMTWLNQVFDTASRFVSNCAATKQQHYMLEPDFRDGLVKIWESRVQPVADSTGAFFKTTLGELSPQDEGYQAWTKLESRIQWLSAYVKDDSPVPAGPQPTQLESWRMRMRLLERMSKTAVLSNSEMVYLVIYLSQREVRECDDKSLATEAKRLWRETQDQDLLQTLIRFCPSVLLDGCAELDPAYPTELLRELVMSSPQQYLAQCYNAPFIGPDLWSEVLKLGGSSSSVELPRPETDLERIKYILAGRDKDDAADADIARIHYAWKYSALVYGIPVLGCPVDVDIDVGRWLCANKLIGEHATEGPWWDIYAERRAAITGQNCGSISIDECARLVERPVLHRTQSRLSRGITAIEFLKLNEK